MQKTQTNHLVVVVVVVNNMIIMIIIISDVVVIIVVVVVVLIIQVNLSQTYLSDSSNVGLKIIYKQNINIL